MTIFAHVANGHFVAQNVKVVKHINVNVQS